jgi:hypothetical protein
MAQKREDRNEQLEILRLLKKQEEKKNRDGGPVDDGVDAVLLRTNMISKALQQMLAADISQKADKGRNKDKWNVASTAAVEGAGAGLPSWAWQDLTGGLPLPTSGRSVLPKVAPLQMTQGVPVNTPAQTHSLYEDRKLTAVTQYSEPSTETPGIPNPLGLAGEYSFAVNSSPEQQLAIEDKRRQRAARRLYESQARRQQTAKGIAKRRAQEKAKTDFWKMVNREQGRFDRDKALESEDRAQARQSNDWMEVEENGEISSPLPPGLPTPFTASLKQATEDRKRQRLADIAEARKGLSGTLPSVGAPPLPTPRPVQKGFLHSLKQTLFGNADELAGDETADARDKAEQLAYEYKQGKRKQKQLNRRTQQAMLDREVAQLEGKDLEPYDKKLEKAQHFSKLHAQQVTKTEKELEDAKQTLAAIGRKNAVAQAGQGMGQLGQLANALGMGATGQILQHGQKVAQARAAGLPTPGGIGLVGAGLGQMSGGAGQAVNSQQLGGNIAGAGQMLGGAGLIAAGAVGGPFGMAIGAAATVAGTFAKGLGDSLEALRKWNDGLLEGNLKFAEYSAAMSMVAAKQMTDEIQLSQERGDRRAGPAAAQQEGRMQLERSLAPLEDSIQNIYSMFSGAGSSWLAEKINLITVAVTFVAEKLGLNNLLPVSFNTPGQLADADPDLQNRFNPPAPPPAPVINGRPGRFP